MIYLDNNATTCVLPDVMEAMLPFFAERFGNPSSLHAFGAQVREEMEKARQQVAELLSAQRESEIVFTSGGTESNNLAIRGVVEANPDKRHLITSAVEHSSVARVCQHLATKEVEVTVLPVQSDGTLDPSLVAKAIRPDTALVTIMWANNETGVLFPIAEIAKICEAKNVPFHVDAIQAASKIPIDLRKAPASLLSISGHKMHAPKGVGALYIRRGTKIATQTFGGRHERSRRAGTENVPGIIGLGKAAELARQKLKEDKWGEIRRLRDYFEQSMIESFPKIKRNGHPTLRVPNTSSLCFTGLEGETIALLLGEAGICVSTGSACMSGAMEPSHVMTAMGLNAKDAKGTIRFSLGTETTKAEIAQTIAALKKFINCLTS